MKGSSQKRYSHYKEAALDSRPNTDRYHLLSNFDSPRVDIHFNQQSHVLLIITFTH